MGVPFCRPSLASQRLAVPVCHALASYSIGFLAKRNGDAFVGNHCIPNNPRTNDIPINDTPHVNDVPHYRQHAHQQCTASSTTRASSTHRIIGSPRTNESGSSIPFGLTLTRKRPAPPNRTAIPEKPRRSGAKRNPSPASERDIKSATLPLTCALARWGFRETRQRRAGPPENDHSLRSPLLRCDRKNFFLMTIPL